LRLSCQTYCDDILVSIKVCCFLLFNLYRYAAGRRALPTPRAGDAYQAANRQTLTADINAALDVGSSELSLPPPPAPPTATATTATATAMTTTTTVSGTPTTRMSTAAATATTTRMAIAAAATREAEEEERQASQSIQSINCRGASAVAVAVAPLPPLDASVDMSSKTPVERAFARATGAAGDAEATTAESARQLQTILLQVKRASDELRFRGGALHVESS
jgi:hypothetical protein